MVMRAIWKDGFINELKVESRWIREAKSHRVATRAAHVHGVGSEPVVGQDHVGHGHRFWLPA
jgi:hypothetical protein